MSVANPVADLVGPFYSSNAAAALLGCPVEALTEFVVRGDVPATITSDGMPLYPVFQYIGAPTGTVRPEIAPALRALAGHSGWSVAIWLRTRNDDLDDLSPDEWLTAGGNPERVRILAARWATAQST